MQTNRIIFAIAIVIAFFSGWSQSAPYYVQYQLTGGITGFVQNAKGYDLFAPVTVRFAYDAETVGQLNAAQTVKTYSPSKMYLSVKIGTDTYFTGPTGYAGSISVVDSGALDEFNMFGTSGVSDTMALRFRYTPSDPATNLALQKSYDPFVFNLANPAQPAPALQLILQNGDIFDMQLYDLTAVTNIIPEPSSLSLLGLAAMGLLQRHGRHFSRQRTR